MPVTEETVESLHGERGDRGLRVDRGDRGERGISGERGVCALHDGLTADVSEIKTDVKLIVAALPSFQWRLGFLEKLVYGGVAVALLALLSALMYSVIKQGAQ